MKRNLIVLVAAILCVSIFFMGCSTTTPAESESASASASEATEAPASTEAAVESSEGTDISGLNIGYILAGPDIYYEQSYQVFEALANEAGWTVTKTSSDYDPKKETNNVQDMIAKQVDAIVLCDVTSSNGAACAKLANDAGIPIFFITTLPDTTGEGQPTASSSGPWYENGYLSAEWMLEQAADPENPKFVLIEGAYGQGTIELQRLGLLTYLSEKLGKPIEQVFEDNIVYNQTGGWMTDQALTVMQDCMAKTGGDFDAIFVGNEAMANGVRKALEPTGKDYPIATENGYEETWDEMRANPDLNMMVCSIPSTAEGELVFQQMKAYFEGVDFPQFVKCPIVPITPANVDSANPLPYKDTEAYLALSKEGKTVNIFEMEDSGSTDPDWSSMIPLNGMKSN